MFSVFVVMVSYIALIGTFFVVLSWSVGHLMQRIFKMLIFICFVDIKR